MWSRHSLRVERTKLSAKHSSSANPRAEQRAARLYTFDTRIRQRQDQTYTRVSETATLRRQSVRPATHARRWTWTNLDWRLRREHHVAGASLRSPGAR